MNAELQGVIARALCMEDNKPNAAWPCETCVADAGDVVNALVEAGYFQTDDGAAAPGHEPGGSRPWPVPEASEVAAGPAPSSPTDDGAATPPATSTATPVPAGVGLAAASATPIAAPSSAHPRCFQLLRHVDISGVSGTGPVAEGTVFTDSTVALRWYGENPATAVWPSLEAVLAVHGHQGATEVWWLDEKPVGYWPVPEGGSN